MFIINPYILGTVPDPVAIGTIKSDNFAGNLSAYSVTNGSGTISIVGGKLRLTGGVGDFGSYIQFSDAASPHRLSMLEKWKISITFVTPTISSTTYGLSMGMRSTNAFTQLDNMVRLSMDTGSPLGSFYFYTAQNHGAPNQDVQSSFSLSSATTYIYEVERNKNQITATLRNSVGTLLNTVTKTYNITTTNGVWSSNVGRFCIWNHGGTIDISSLTITSDSLRYATFMGCGDSNMHGLYATTNANRYTEKSATIKGYPFEILAGIDQGVGDVLSYLDQIIYMAPRKVYLNCVSNSIANGVSAGTYQADYQTLVTGIKTALPATTIYHGIPVARGANYTSLWTNFLSSTYPGEPQVNLFLVTKNAGNDNIQSGLTAGDNIHMNVAGNNTCEPILTAAI